jgi:hypothetical protein
VFELHPLHSTEGFNAAYLFLHVSYSFSYRSTETPRARRVSLSLLSYSHYNDSQK